MYKLPRSIQNAISRFASLQNLGDKTAERMVFALLREDPQTAEHLWAALQNLWKWTKTCHICGVLTEENICELCQKEAQGTALCVVKDSYDLLIIERSGAFSGRYHVLGGLLSPMDGITPDKLRIESLIDRIASEDISEIIFALDANLPGNATVNYIQDKLTASDITIPQTHLAHGIPVGADLSGANEQTIREAIENRR